MKYLLFALLGALALLAVLLLVALLHTLIKYPAKQMGNQDYGCKDEERNLRYANELAQMIKEPTVSARGDEDLTKFYKLHDVLKQLFPTVWEKCEVIDLEGSLLIKWAGKGTGKSILLMSHMDVVSAEGDNWIHDPFGGEIIDGEIWGRGTTDIKNNLYCILKAAEELLQEGYTPDVDVYIASSCTEEIGGKGAPMTAKWLKDHGVHLAFTMDEGGCIVTSPMAGVEGKFGMIGAVEKGYGDLKFIARSKGGHSSAPPANSPLVRLGKFMSYVETKKPFQAVISPNLKEMFLRMAPYMAFPLRFVVTNLWLFGGVLTRVLPALSPAAGAMTKTTIAFTQAQGSGGCNVLPQEAWVVGNMRYIPHQNCDESVALITKIAAMFDIEVEIIQAGSAGRVVDHNCAAFKQTEAAAAKFFPGMPMIPYVVTGGTDSRFYEEVSDVNLRFAPYSVTPEQFPTAHAANERVNIDTLPVATDFYKEIIKTSM